MGMCLNNLRFADDIILNSSRIEDLKKMIKDLNEGGKKAGLNINLEKTKIKSKSRN